MNSVKISENTVNSFEVFIFATRGLKHFSLKCMPNFWSKVSVMAIYKECTFFYIQCHHESLHQWTPLYFKQERCSSNTTQVTDTWREATDEIM